MPSGATADTFRLEIITMVLVVREVLATDPLPNGNVEVTSLNPVNKL